MKIPSLRILPLATAAILGGWGLSHSAFGAQAGAIDRLAWMAGCWEVRVADRQIEERWMAPRSGLMLGMSRTVVAGRLAGFEQLLILQDSSGLVFRANPSGQAEAEFRGVELSDTSATFENPAHDFPQRVVYRSTAGGDSLLARVEGTMNGVLRGSDFPYARVDCRS